MRALIRICSLIVGIVIAASYFAHTHAAFVSRGGSFSAGRSFSAPRAYSAPRSSFVPRATYTAPRTVYHSNTTVIHSSPAVVHHDSGHGFFSGMLLGSMFGHSNAPVVVQQPVVAAAPVPITSPMVSTVPAGVDQSYYIAQQQTNWFAIFVVLCIIVFFGMPLAIYLWRKL